MPNTKKPRKKYRPKTVRLDNTTHVLQGMSLLAPSTIADVQLHNHSSMLALTQGNGTMGDWQRVTGALNMAVVLDEQTFQSAYHDDLLAALKAHGRCGVRAFKGGKYGYSGPDLTAVNYAFEIHNEQLKRCTVGEMERALLESEDRSKNKREHFTVRQMAEESEKK